LEVGIWLVSSTVIFVLAATMLPSGEKAVVRITVLLDTSIAVEGTEPGWGFSCLVEAPGGTVLFDTGPDGEILRQNLSALGLDLENINAIVLSRRHGEHALGLAEAMRGTSGVRVYPLAGAAAQIEDVVQRSGGPIVPVTGPIQIVSGMWSTGEVEGSVAEQAMLVETAKGPVVVTGSAHPSTVRLAERGEEVAKRPPKMILGGFHLLRFSGDEVSEVIKDLRTLGVVETARTRQTGDEATSVLRDKFVEGFTPLGVGAVVEFGG
jgi:7,8-dihydropterin-6-yl-methyl-4-(beta-D-ribofuranosyl)aminobenzene 5'-phosphate synthase